MTSAPPASPYLRVRETAALLRVSNATVLRWIKIGILPATRVGGTFLVDRDGVHETLDRNRVA